LGRRNAQKGVEGGLDKIGTADGDIAMENLLKDFGIGDEAFAVADESFEQALRVGFVRMRAADQIPREVGVQKNHRPESGR
jgi:hypothetical protein